MRIPTLKADADLYIMIRNRAEKILFEDIQDNELFSRPICEFFGYDKTPDKRSDYIDIILRSKTFMCEDLTDTKYKQRFWKRGKLYTTWIMYPRKIPIDFIKEIKDDEPFELSFNKVSCLDWDTDEIVKMNFKVNIRVKGVYMEGRLYNKSLDEIKEVLKML